MILIGDLRDQSCYNSIIQAITVDWTMWLVGEVCIGALVGRPGRKQPMGRQRQRWEDNIKRDMEEVGYKA